jgi:hypothetical protein
VSLQAWIRGLCDKTLILWDLAAEELVFMSRPQLGMMPSQQKKYEILSWEIKRLVKREREREPCTLPMFLLCLEIKFEVKIKTRRD